MNTHGRSRPILLLGGLCLAGACTIAGDERAGRTGDPDDGPITTTHDDTETAHSDESPRGVLATQEGTAGDDECGLSSQRERVRLTWVSTGAHAELAVDFDDGFEGTAEVQFYAVSLPVTESGALAVGEPVTLSTSSRSPLPGPLLAAVNSRTTTLAVATVQACRADAPPTDCIRYTANEAHIEDGRVFVADAYPSHLRNKWGAEKPWLFGEHVVTGIVDMEGR